MILAWIRFGLSALCMLGGVFVMTVSIIGLFHFDFALNRIHASAMSDTLGLVLILAGVMIAIGFHAVVWKLLLVLIPAELVVYFSFRIKKGFLISEYMKKRKKTQE